MRYQNNCRMLVYMHIAKKNSLTNFYMFSFQETYNFNDIFYVTSARTTIEMMLVHPPDIRGDNLITISSTQARGVQ